MKEEERVFLPSKLGEKWNEVEIDVFKDLVDGISKGNTALSFIVDNKTDCKYARHATNFRQW
jgi:hypothetical protein